MTVRKHTLAYKHVSAYIYIYIHTICRYSHTYIPYHTVPYHTIPYRHADIQTYILVQTYRHVGIQTYRHTATHTYAYIHVCASSALYSRALSFHLAQAQKSQAESCSLKPQTRPDQLRKGCEQPKGVREEVVWQSGLFRLLDGRGGGPKKLRSLHLKNMWAHVCASSALYSRALSFHLAQAQKSQAESCSLKPQTRPDQLRKGCEQPKGVREEVVWQSGLFRLCTCTSRIRSMRRVRSKLGAEARQRGCLTQKQPEKERAEPNTAVCAGGARSQKRVYGRHLLQVVAQRVLVP